MLLVAVQNVYLVTLGTVVGHSCCTALAVIGGRYISTKISVKHGACARFIVRLVLISPPSVTLGGSLLFLAFGVIYLYEAFVMDADTADLDFNPAN